MTLEQEDRKLKALESIAISLASLARDGIEIYISRDAFPVEIKRMDLGYIGVDLNDERPIKVRMVAQGDNK